MNIETLAAQLEDLKAHAGEAAAQAASIREQDAAKSPMFDVYRRARESNDFDAMERSFGFVRTALDMAAGRPLDVSPIRWAAQHPEELAALADLYDANRDYHDRRLAEFGRLRSEFDEMRAEAERMAQARVQAAQDLPDTIARLEKRIRELESRAVRESVDGESDA